jgi:hypothetical protein
MKQETLPPTAFESDTDLEPCHRLSAKAARRNPLDGSALTEAEIEAAEEEALLWARRANSC